MTQAEKKKINDIMKKVEEAQIEMLFNATTEPNQKVNALLNQIWIALNEVEK